MREPQHTKGVQHIRIFRGKMTSQAIFFLVFVETVILIVDSQKMICIPATRS